MKEPHVTWEGFMREYLGDDPAEAQLYLDVALEDALRDGNWPGFLGSIRTLVEVNGGVGQLARKMKCSRTTLYRTLSAKGNPRLDTLGAILRALGLRLSIQVSAPAKATRVAGRRGKSPVPAKRKASKVATATTVVKASAKAKRVAAKR